MKMKQLLKDDLPQPDLTARLVHLHKSAPDTMEKDQTIIPTLCFKTTSRDFVASGSKHATCKLCITTALTRIALLETARPPTQEDAAILALRVSRLRSLLP